jgi:hydrogenase expression/formation protein HypC
MCLAIPGKLISVSDTEDELLRTGRVDFGGIVKEVSLSCVPEAEIGQYLLVHVGLAISVVDEEQAQLVFEYLREAGELDELDTPEPGDAIH